MSDINDQISKIRQLLELNSLHRNEANEPLVIGFAAVPGSGKTTLARRLEVLVHATRFNRDDVRGLILKTYPNVSGDEFTTLLNAVTRGILKEILSEWPNKRVILDSSLDRTYESTRKFLGANIPIYLIRIIPIWSELEKRIRERTDNWESPDEYLAKLPQLRRDWDEFAARQPADIVWDQSKDDADAIASAVADTIGQKYL